MWVSSYLTKENCLDDENLLQFDEPKGKEKGMNKHWSDSY